MAVIRAEELRALVSAALKKAGANEAMAAATAQALVLAEAQGIGSHGLSRVAQYATHLRNGRVDGAAVARVLRAKGGAAVVDAGEGLAFPACALAVEEGIARAHTRRRLRRRGAQPPLRRARRPPARGGGGRHGRPRLRQFPRGDAGGRRPPPDLRDQPGGRGGPAPGGGGARDRARRT